MPPYGRFLKQNRVGVRDEASHQAYNPTMVPTRLRPQLTSAEDYSPRQIILKSCSPTQQAETDGLHVAG